MGFGVCCGCALHTVGSATEMLRISVPALPLFAKNSPPGCFFTQKPSRVRIPITKKARYECTLLFLWRRGWDSASAAAAPCILLVRRPKCCAFQYPPCRFLLKTARRAVFFTQKPSRVRIPIIRKARYECTLLFLWRRGWDSNPCGFWPNGFQDRLVMTASIPLRID